MKHKISYCAKSTMYADSADQKTMHGSTKLTRVVRDGAILQRAILDNCMTVDSSALGGLMMLSTRTQHWVKQTRYFCTLL